MTAIGDAAERIVDLQLESPYKVLGILGLLTLAIAPGALQMDVKPSTEAILPEDDPVVESLDTLRGKFSGDTTYLVLQGERDVRRSDTMKKMLRIQNRVERSENVLDSTSPASVLKQRYGEIPEDRQRLEKPDYGGMITESRQTALVSFRADTQAKSGEIRDLHSRIRSAAGSEFERSRYYLTGYNMIDLATFEVIIKDFSTITGVSFTAVLMVLYGVFRDLRQMLFPILPVVFALLWMVGLGGYLGADLTIISMVSAAMIMGLGIDFGIHVTRKHFGSERQDARGLKESMRELSRGLLGGSMTTGVGFLALLAANLSGMHALGVFLFTGIVSAYIGAVFLLPTVIVLSEDLEPLN